MATVVDRILLLDDSTLGELVSEWIFAATVDGSADLTATERDVALAHDVFRTSVWDGLAAYVSSTPSDEQARALQALNRFGMMAHVCALKQMVEAKPGDLLARESAQKAWDRADETEDTHVLLGRFVRRYPSEFSLARLDVDPSALPDPGIARPPADHFDVILVDVGVEPRSTWSFNQGREIQELEIAVTLTTTTRPFRELGTPASADAATLSRLEEARKVKGPDTRAFRHPLRVQASPRADGGWIAQGEVADIFPPRDEAEKISLTLDESGVLHPIARTRRLRYQTVISALDRYVLPVPRVAIGRGARWTVAHNGLDGDTFVEVMVEHMTGSTMELSVSCTSNWKHPRGQLSRAVRGTARVVLDAACVLPEVDATEEIDSRDVVETVERQTLVQQHLHWRRLGRAAVRE